MTMETVKDVMCIRPISVQKALSFKDLAVTLREYRVSEFPVLDDGGIVIGVVSEADLLAKEALKGRHHGMWGMITNILHRKELLKAAGVTAGDLMTSPAVTIAPDDTVEHAARLMYTRRLKRLPVVDTVGRLVGIISRADVLGVFDRSDDEIRVEITSQVLPRLSEPSRYSVTVKDGIVTVEGTPETIPIGLDILTQARHVQGVVAVRDRLAYPLPPMPAAPGPYFPSYRRAAPRRSQTASGTTRETASLNRR
jgi:CBS domain-containing protein